MGTHPSTQASLVTNASDGTVLLQLDILETTRDNVTTRTESLLDLAVYNCAAGSGALSVRVLSISVIDFSVPCNVAGLINAGSNGVLRGVVTRDGGSNLTLVVEGDTFRGASMRGALSVGWARSDTTAWEVESGVLTGRGHIRACDDPACAMMSGAVTLQRGSGFGAISRTMDVEAVRLKLVDKTVTDSTSELVLTGSAILDSNGQLVVLRAVERRQISVDSLACRQRQSSRLAAFPPRAHVKRTG